MTQVEQVQSRIVREGFAYWQAALRGRSMPARRDLDPPLEVPHLVPNIILFDVLDPLDFRYRLIGTRVRAHLMHDMTGKRMSEIEFQQKPSVVWSHHEWVVENRLPRFIRPPYVGPHRDFMFIEAAILPLGAAGDRVEMMLVFVDFITGR